MYFHFKRNKPAHKQRYSYFDKTGALIGEGSVPSFSMEKSTYQAIFQGCVCDVTIVHDRPRTTPTENPNVWSTDVGSFSIAGGAENVITWCFSDSVTKGRFGGQKEYNWWTFTYQGDKYALYRIGLGGKGYFFQLWKNDVLVAAVDKALWVKNFCDTYEVFLQDSEDASVMVALLGFINLYFYNHYGQGALFNISRVVRQTEAEEVFAKFDPEFIPRMREQEGV